MKNLRAGSPIFPGRSIRPPVTLLTEVQVPNADGRLFPGAYAQVHLVLPVKPTMVIPSNALLFRSNGLQVGLSTETASSTSGT